MGSFKFSKMENHPKNVYKYTIPWFRKGWDQIDLPPYPPDGKEENFEELKKLKKLIKSNKKKNWEEIKEQDAESSNFIDPFIEIVGDKERNFIKELVSQLYKIVHHYKNKFDRPRPWHMAKELNFHLPHLKSESGNNPSYPSGHAFAAYFLSEILGKRHPEHKHKLVRHANNVANNRMRGGVHYPSDIKAAKLLVKKLIPLFIEPGKLHFKEWLKEKGQ